jgi:hypothetical protein
VRALRNIHSALRPGGLLLDIHPEPRHPWLIAEIGAQTIPVGQLDVSIHIDTVHSARAALQRIIDAGLFVPEREAQFTFTYQFATIDAWLDYMAGHWVNATIPERLVERAHELLEAGNGELRIPRDVHAARLRKP